MQSKQTTDKRHVTLYLEANPNPNSLKFVANYMLLPEGATFDFADKEAAHISPLAQELLEHPHVERVFYMSNFVTVTKSADVEWIEIQAQIKAQIQQYLESGRALITKQPDAAALGNAPQTDTETKIVNILDEYVRPAVESDGGAIQFHSFEGGVVKVLLQGSCSGCPSSTITLKAGIENLLKRMVPEVQSVEAQGV
ncbi:NifU family protein [Cesiribacter andamanensis]|uniref:Fe-S cluster assembly protein NifU n=1 Tax=Cesiribacter andamanensis AMV16 TaxID=1279009 RepID=M7N5W9_9BACT|nr:NifU family protein [Cesiribacter andamanensis]EMR02636.1 Fe-S cluster assembly protein NifU [Cesiribacter andamanensis AMV16]